MYPMNRPASLKQNQCTAGHGNYFRANLPVELLKFSMIHILQLNSSPIFSILGKHELRHRELSGMRELWQPVRADYNRRAQATRTTPFSDNTMSKTADVLTNYCDDN